MVKRLPLTPNHVADACRLIGTDAWQRAPARAVDGDGPGPANGASLTVQRHLLALLYPPRPTALDRPRRVP